MYFDIDTNNRWWETEYAIKFKSTIYQIHYSIFIAQVIGCSLSALCLYLGLKPFIKSVDYLKKYLAVSNQN